MTKIKLCGMTRAEDIDCVNELLPEYIGFVFVKKSRRYVAPEQALTLSRRLRPEITPVGVFVNEDIDNIAAIVRSGAIRAVQLHGSEDGDYIAALRESVSVPVIQAFRIETPRDIERARRSAADYIMLDSGGGTGRGFDHTLITEIGREFFLAGGLDAENAAQTAASYRPYALDVSSALETNGLKDKNKMAAFVEAVRKG